MPAESATPAVVAFGASQPSTGSRAGSPADSPDLGWLLSSLLRAYLKQAGAAVAELPGGPRGYQVLLIAARGACRNQAGIAEHLGVDRTVMTYLLDDLEQAKLIKRQADPADRRSRQIVLTARGQRTLTRLSGQIGAVEQGLLTDLTPGEAQTLRELLNRAARGLGAFSAGSVPDGGACSLPSEC